MPVNLSVVNCQVARNLSLLSVGNYNPNVGWSNPGMGGVMGILYPPLVRLRHQLGSRGGIQS